jgi:hypothetical protein
VLILETPTQGDTFRRPAVAFSVDFEAHFRLISKLIFGRFRSSFRSNSGLSFGPIRGPISVQIGAQFESKSSRFSQQIGINSGVILVSIFVDFKQFRTAFWTVLEDSFLTVSKSIPVNSRTVLQLIRSRFRSSFEEEFLQFRQRIR